MVNETDIKESHNARAALITAAKKLFTEKGFEAVSTRELAEAAHVNLGAIQYHFGSKAKLFVETIHELMERGGHDDLPIKIESPIRSKREAAIHLSSFIFRFLDYLLHCEGPQPCRLMFREVFSNTSNDHELFETLTASVVNDFMRPVDEPLMKVLIVLMPDATQMQLHHTAQSILGQCAFYVTHRPFLERLRSVELKSESTFLATAVHVCRFSLKAIGCEAKLIDEVVKEISSTWTKRHKGVEEKAA